MGLAQEQGQDGQWLARVFVLPKQEVLDPQGEAILGALRHLDVHGIDAVRSGRLFELSITASGREAAGQLADDAARRLLCNTVVETYRLELVAVQAGTGLAASVETAHDAASTGVRV